MRDVDIRDYIGHAKELTAEQVRKLAPGTAVIRHSFDRYGAHQTCEMTVAQSGKKKVLITSSYYGGRVVRQIAKETDRVCYTEVNA